MSILLKMSKVAKTLEMCRHMFILRNRKENEFF